jgi:hypothetical protein
MDRGPSHAETRLWRRRASPRHQLEILKVAEESERKFFTTFLKKHEGPS